MAKKSVKIQTGNTSENFHLQCEHNVSDVNRTVHILADYFSTTVVSIRKRTKDFAKLHIAWVEQIGYDIYSHIKKTPMDYVDSIDKAKTPFDELTITIFAQIMQIHIGVVMKTYHWTTSSCLELAICDIVLGYAGPRRTENRDGVYPLMFDTLSKVHVPPPPRQTDPQIVAEVAEFLNELKRKRDLHDGQSIVQDGQSGTKDQPTVTLQSGKDDKPTVAVQSGKEDEPTVTVQSGTEDQPTVTVQSGKEDKPTVTVQSGQDAVPSGMTPPVQSDEKNIASGNNKQVQSGNNNGLLAGKKKSSGLLQSYLAADAARNGHALHDDTDTYPVAKKAKKGRTTKNSQKAGKIEGIETRRSRPENLKEPDPISEALGDASPLRSDDEGTEHNSESGHESPAPSQEITTEQGRLKITDSAICHGRKKRKINLKCPVADCGQRFQSEKSRNDHIKTDHPDKKFVCSECGKGYSTSNGLWKHHNKHFAPKFCCDWENCKWKFHFKNELVSHMKTHTGQGKIPCTWKGCQRLFVSTKNMYGHLESHNDTRYPCSECDQVFKTKYNYKQHFVGKHMETKSLKAKCGEGFKWPEERAKHQDTCEECRAIFEQLEARPAKPARKCKSDDTTEEEPKQQIDE